MSSLPEGLTSTLADRYRIERELGRGGMATVYLADDIRHGRRVAIKVLSPEVAAAIGHERFLREIEIAARLTHPHILPLLGAEAADRAWQEGRRIPFEEAIRLGLEARAPAGS